MFSPKTGFEKFLSSFSNWGSSSNRCNSVTRGNMGQQLLNSIDAFLSEGGVDHRGDLGGALLLLHPNLH